MCITSRYKALPCNALVGGLLPPVKLGGSSPPSDRNSALDVDVGWVERSATQLIIRMLGYAKPPPNKAIFWENFSLDGLLQDYRDFFRNQI
ncbi:MAG: hypothetical protein V7K27_09650 [Nostoc sp.]|uniref:hypothetical protein n=1 Tax=Nostoc sp. TaxID=1180 RepID=UPI002FF8A292